MQVSNDESIKSELSVDMSEVINEQETVVEADYKEVTGNPEAESEQIV